MSETPQGQDGPAPSSPLANLETPASAVGENKHSASHDLHLEPTATPSSATLSSATDPPRAVSDAVEVIDVDQLSDPPHTSFAIKQEPDSDGRWWTREPFMTWHNTSADPIVIEEDGETQVHGSTCQAPRIPKGGIAGAGFRDRLRSVQQTFFKLTRQPKAVEAPPLSDPPPAITSACELGTDEMDIDTSDDEARVSWER